MISCLDHVVGDEGGHAVVNAPPGQDHLRVEADLLRLVRQIIRIDANTVTTDQARTEGLEVPFGAGPGPLSRPLLYAANRRIAARAGFSM